MFPGRANRQLRNGTWFVLTSRYLFPSLGAKLYMAVITVRPMKPPSGPKHTRQKFILLKSKCSTPFPIYAVYVPGYCSTTGRRAECTLFIKKDIIGKGYCQIKVRKRKPGI